MSNVNLVLSLPTGVITATSLGLPGFAWHRSPGTSGKFHGHSVLVDLALKDGYPAFEFMNEGGWRDPQTDSRAALDTIRTGKRTKTALSNSAFNCTPLSAYAHVYLGKISGALMEMLPRESLTQFKAHACAEHLTPDQIAATVGSSRVDLQACKLEYSIVSPK